MKKEQTSLDFRTTVLSIMKHLRKKEDELLLQYGLTHFHAMYIRNLFIHGQLTMSELTRIIGVDKANTTRVVHDLIDREIVAKLDGERKFKLELTALGRQVAHDFKANLDKFMEKVYIDFSPEEKEQMQNLMNKLMLGVKKAMEE